MVGTSVPRVRRNRVIACRQALSRTEDLKGVWALLVCRCRALPAVGCRLSLRVMSDFFCAEWFCKSLLCIKPCPLRCPGEVSRAEARPELCLREMKEPSRILFHAWEERLACCLLPWVKLPLSPVRAVVQRSTKSRTGFRQACLPARSNVQNLMTCECSCQNTVRWASLSGSQSLVEEMP